VRIRTAQNSRSKNAQFLRCKIEDLTGEVECLMWGDEYARHKDVVAEDRVCFVKGTLDDRSTRSEPTLILSRILTVEQMQREGCGEVWLRVKLGEHQPAMIDHIADVLKRYPGTCPVTLVVLDPAGRRSQLRLGPQFRVNPLAFQPAEVEALLGPGSVKLVGNGSTRNGR
jgi:DNA polymerase-3 subunit alpha